MNVEFRRVVFTDVWFSKNQSVIRSMVIRLPTCLRWLMPPDAGEPYEFTNYALGFRFEPTPREMKLIVSHNLSTHSALTLRDGDAPLTFAQILGPEFVPVLNPSQMELLRVEGKVREAVATWSHFFETMKGGS